MCLNTLSQTQVAAELPTPQSATHRSADDGYKDPSIYSRQKRSPKGWHRRGTSLIEILVVIVVFLVGILAVIQIYPGGFRILNNTRSLAIANAFAHDFDERIKAREDQLPDAIIPVGTPLTASLGFGAPDGTRTIDDMSVYDEANSQINGDGSLTYQGNTFQNYSLYSGPNVFRRILGEGIKIPAPTSIGNYFGGLAILQYGPVRQMASDFFPISVYSTDYQVNLGAFPVGSSSPGQVYVDDPNSSNGNLSVYIEDDSAAGAPAPAFKMSLVIYVTVGGVLQRQELTNVPLNIPTNPGTLPQFRWFTVPLNTLVPPGTTYLSCDLNTLHLQRIFNQVAPNAFSQVDPFQVNLFNAPTGTLLFNPLSYNYMVTGNGGTRLSLRAKVDYEVLDWHILHDDIRLGNSETMYRLSIPGVKVLNNVGADGLIYHGIGVRMPDNNLNLIFADVMFQDVATGGLFLYAPSNPRDPTPPNLASNDIWIDPTKSSFFVDKSAGTFKLVDANRSTLNGAGLQLMLCLPDPTSTSGYASPVPVNAEGRTIRVYYMARNEWMAFPRAAVGLYHNANLPAAAGVYALSPGQYEIGSTTRIYFPASDIGNKVSIDQVYYTDASNNVHLVENQSFIVKNGSDPHGPYVDLTDVATDAVQFDTSHGYSVQGIHGASVSTRVLFNPEAFHIGPPAGNNSAFDLFNQSWRRITVDTILQRGSN